MLSRLLLLSGTLGSSYSLWPKHQEWWELSMGVHQGRALQPGPILPGAGGSRHSQGARPGQARPRHEPERWLSSAGLVAGEMKPSLAAVSVWG